MFKWEISNIFKERKADIIGNYKKHGIMIPLYEENGKIYIVLEKRALTLRSQPGDICFPGGRMEEGEEPMDTAVRETCEELNIKEYDINVIGQMDYLITPYSQILYPYVGMIKKFPNSPSVDEVDSLIKVPLEFFINNQPLLYDMKIGPVSLDGFPFELIEGGTDYKFSTGIMKEYFYKYEDIIIWGFTASIIKSFIDIVRNKIV